MEPNIASIKRELSTPRIQSLDTCGIKQASTEAALIVGSWCFTLTVATADLMMSSMWIMANVKSSYYWVICTARVPSRPNEHRSTLNASACSSSGHLSSFKRQRSVAVWWKVQKGSRSLFDPSCISSPSFRSFRHHVRLHPLLGPA